MIDRHQQLSRYIAILLLGPLLLFGQEYRPDISHISLRNGLSQNTVMEAIQDQQGFLWVGTQDGLNKYDGYDFRVFKALDQDSSTISNNYIKTMVLDANNNLWLGTQIGLNRYDKQTGTFTRFLSGSSMNRSRIVVTDLVSFQNSLWIGTENGLIHLKDINKPTFEEIRTDLEEFSIVKMLKDDSENLWIATEAGQILCFDLKDGKLYQLDSILPEKPLIRCLEIFEDKLWLGTSDGLYSINLNELIKDAVSDELIATSKSLTQYQNPTQNFEVLSILKDSKGHIWVGSQSEGVFMFNMESQEFYEFIAGTEEDPNVFETTSVGKIFEDGSHNIWIGTVETGLFKIRQSGKKFGLLRLAPGENVGLSSNRIRGLMKRGNTIWIGTSKGLTLFDRNDMSYKVLFHDPANTNSISSDDIKTMVTDQFDFVWIATNDGLNRMDPQTNYTDRFYAGEFESGALIEDNKVRTVVSLSDGNVWVGSLGGGISVIDPRSLKLVKYYTHDPLSDKSLSSNNVMNIFQDSNDEIWAATYGGGLNKLSEDGTHWKRIGHKKENGIPLLLSTVNEDNRGFLWIGTYGSGLVKLNKEDLSFELFTEQDGLSNNVTYAGLPHKDDIWISTNYGINKYSLDTKEFVNYNASDGLQSNEFNSGSYLICESGEIFFGGVNGLTFFYPDSIFNNTSIPKLAFTDFMIFNESVAPNEVIIGAEAPINELVRDSTQITLSHRHNVFTIKYAALDFTSPDDLSYAHQLVGFDKEWIYSSSDQRAATYTNLKPGEYRFLMKAANDDGVWTDRPITLFITVRPSLIQSWWFRTFAIVLMLSLLARITYRRINKVERRKKVLEKKIAEHTKEISEQNIQLTKSAERLRNLNGKKDQMLYLLAHNVRAPLTTLMALLNEFRSSDTKLKEEQFKTYLGEVDKNLNDSVLLLDNTFYWSKLQFDDVYIADDLISLDELVDLVIKKNERILAKKSVSVKKEITPLNTKGDRKLLAIILHNLLENAIKYSYQKGEINIAVRGENNLASVVVTDNGTGLTKEEMESLFDEDRNVNRHGTANEKGTGLGLLVSYKLAKKMGYDLNVRSVTGETQFQLSVPLVK